MTTKRSQIPKDTVEFLSDADAITATPTPTWARSALYLLSTMIFVFVVWASLSNIDRIVTARGKLISTSNTITVQPFVTSVVKEIRVKEGDIVKKDQLLGTFDPTFSSSDLERLKSQSNELDARLSRLEAELANANAISDIRFTTEYGIHQRVLIERLANFNAKLEHYEQALSRIRANITANNQDRLILTERLAAAEQIEAMKIKMRGQGNVSQLNVLEARENRLSLQNELQTAINQTLLLQQQVKTAEAELNAFKQNHRAELIEEIANVSAELTSTNEQVAKAERLASLTEMRSPIDAVVLKIADRSVGSVLKEAEPLITLVPLDAPLEAKLEIDPQDIGYIRPDDRTILKLDAFPFQKHGSLKGALTVIGEDVISDQTRNPEKTFYEARATLGNDTLRELPEDARFIPGMSLTGEIVVGQRSIISYFLYPVMRILDEGLREP